MTQEEIYDYIKQTLKPIYIRRLKNHKGVDGKNLVTLPPFDIQIIYCKLYDIEQEVYDYVKGQSQKQI